MKRETILVTGAAGFIGMHCSLKLLGQGHQVIGVDNLNSYYSQDLKQARLQKLLQFEEFIFVQEDIERINSHCNIKKWPKIDRVLHLAAQAGVRYSITNPRAYIQSNVVGFHEMLEFCRHNNVDDFVYASSSSVYGESETTPFYEGHPTDSPVSLYAATKKANEAIAHSYASLYNINCTGLRFFTVYGPWGRPDMAPFLFANAILEGREIELFNHGNMERDFTYIEDIATAVNLVLFANKSSNEGFSTSSSAKFNPLGGSNRVLNIGNSNPVNLRTFLRTLEASLNRTAIIQNRDMQPGDVRVTFADTKTLEKWINYKPNTDLKHGIAEFSKWLLDYSRSGVSTK